MRRAVHTLLPVTTPRPLFHRLPSPTLTGWSLESLSGRLVEISASGETAALTATCDLVLQAQLKGEPSAWITLLDSSFFPPDAACSGIDLDALPVVRVPDPSAAARAADKLTRSGGFGLIVVDLTTAAFRRPAWGADNRDGQSHAASGTLRKPTGSHTSPHRSFPRATAGIPTALQSRLLGLARKHHTAIVFLTEKDEYAPSLGPLVSLRAEARRRRSGNSTFTCEIRVIKDKRRGPGRSHRQTYHGPAGLR